MPKHNKIPHKRNIEVSPKLPAIVQARQLRAALDEVKRQAAKMRRLLWLAVFQAGGRVKMTEGDYRSAMEMPGEDCIVSVEHDKEAKEVFLIFTDKEGKRLPESEPKLVVLTDPD